MVSTRQQRKQVLQTYYKYTPKDFCLYTFMPSSIKPNKKGVLGLQYWSKTFKLRWLPLPDVVYNRCYDSQSSPLLNKDFVHIPFFNQINHFNKMEIDGLLRNSDLSAYLPDTLPYCQENLSRMLSQYGTVILKPILGNKGYGVYRIERKETGDIHISQHYQDPFLIFADMSILDPEIKKLLGTHDYLIQQGISLLPLEGKLFDIRVLVQKNKSGQWRVSNMVSRISYSGCFNTSFCESVSRSDEQLRRLFSRDHADALLQSLQDASLQAAACIEQQGEIHLGEISVDFGVDSNEKLWIIEVNGQPQKSIYKELQLSRDVYRNPVEYAQFLQSQRQ